MLNLSIQISQRPPVDEYPFEIVERKGSGHPDTLADGISEAIAGWVCSYRRNSLLVPYHYSDKVFLIGGASEPAFRGGRILSPFRVIVASVLDLEMFQLSPTTIQANIKEVVYSYLQRTLRYFERSSADIEVLIIPPSRHSISTYLADPNNMEDTGIGVGYAPLTPCEELTLNLERFLTSEATKKRFPMLGEDIKCLTVRTGRAVTITLACAFVSRFIDALTHYRSCKQQLETYIVTHCKIDRHNLSVRINPDDVFQPPSVYLTVSGASIEHGDCGFTGRGNRINGLISPLRPMTIEAAAGKNAQNHPGKLYNLLATRIANDLVARLQLRETSVLLLGEVGAKITQPTAAYVDVIPKGDVPPDLDVKISQIVMEWQQRIPNLRAEYLSTTATQT